MNGDLFGQDVLDILDPQIESISQEYEVRFKAFEVIDQIDLLDPFGSVFVDIVIKLKLAIGTNEQFLFK